MSFVAMVGEIWPILWWISKGVRVSTATLADLVESMLTQYMPQGEQGIWPTMESFSSWIVHEPPPKVVV